MKNIGTQMDWQNRSVLNDNLLFFYLSVIYDNIVIMFTNKVVKGVLCYVFLDTEIFLISKIE